MMERLNEQQQKLVEKYSYLIDNYMHYNNLSYDGVTDYYGLLADTLCKASRAYDWRKGSFINYIDKCFWNAIQNQKIYECRKGRKTNEIIDIDELNENDLHYINDDIDSVETVIDFYNKSIDNFYISLTDREKQVFDCLFKLGLSQIDSSKMIGITRKNVWETKDRIIHKYYKYMRVNNYV